MDRNRSTRRCAVGVNDALNDQRIFPRFTGSTAARPLLGPPDKAPEDRDR